MQYFVLLLLAGVVAVAIVFGVIFFLCNRKRKPAKGIKTQPEWNDPLKHLYARHYTVKRWKEKLPPVVLQDLPRSDMSEGWDSVSLRATGTDGSALLLGIRKLCRRQPLAEVTVYVKLPDGTSYNLPNHPDTVIGHWEDAEGAWSAGGLKIQLLEPEVRLRILYNGLLTSVDGVKQHVKFNYIWCSSSAPSRYPEDWSDELAAHALALEQWRDANWPHMLGKWGERGWLQWGSVQGRFQSYDGEGMSDKSDYLRVRGVKERRWAPHAHPKPRRSMLITAIAKDGTGVQIRAVSYTNVLTECISGCVRLPTNRAESITKTDLSLANFNGATERIPSALTINLSTKSRDFKIVLRLQSDGGRLLSGVPYEQEFEFCTLVVDINGEPGSGILQLGYEASAISDPLTNLPPPRSLKWLRKDEAGEVGYCLPFEARAAACPDYFGGKGASLALLASVQEASGYKVPPGFCLSTRALEQHLQSNAELLRAVRDIEAENEDYDEDVFKSKCSK